MQSTHYEVDIPNIHGVIYMRELGHMYTLGSTNHLITVFQAIPIKHLFEPIEPLIKTSSILVVAARSGPETSESIIHVHTSPEPRTVFLR